jgi:hypothetical protein
VWSIRDGWDVAHLGGRVSEEVAPFPSPAREDTTMIDSCAIEARGNI